MPEFKYFDQNTDGKFLLIESDRLENTIEFIQENNIDSIYLGDFWGYNLDNIKPLFGLKGIKRFQYQESYSKCSMEGIENFKDLEYLRIDGAHKVDLSAFTKLKYLNFKWDKEYSSLDKCLSLEEIDLWNFNTKEKDFSNFPLFPKLKKLKCYWGNALTLEGLELPKSIKELEFHLYNKLKNINQLASFESLEQLKFETCKRIENHGIVRHLKNLESLFFSDTGKTENLDFVKEMKRMKWFGFLNTNILSGDLSPLDDEKFKFIGFDNKRHYNRKYEDLKPK